MKYIIGNNMSFFKYYIIHLNEKMLYIYEIYEIIIIIKYLL